MASAASKSVQDRSATSEAPDDSLAPGTRIGAYRVVRHLKRGGAADVYQVESEDGRRFALKRMAPRHAGDRDLRLRFHREARAAAAVTHPNLIRVHAVENDGDIPCLMMDLLEGEDLATRLAHPPALSIAESIAIVAPIAQALSALHAAEIIHRDVKPSNIFLAHQPDGSERPVLLDLGIARLDFDADRTALTNVAQPLGTPYYLAPEQARSDENIDGRADQYALGATLYECVTGRRAFSQQALYELLRAIVAGDCESPRAVNPAVPEALDAAIRRAMNPDRLQRFPSLGDFESAVGEASRSTTRAPSSVKAPPRSPRSIGAWLAGAATLSIATAAIALLVQRHPAVASPTHASNVSAIAPVAVEQDAPGAQPAPSPASVTAAAPAPTAPTTAPVQQSTLAASKSPEPKHAGARSKTHGAHLRGLRSSPAATGANNAPIVD